MRTVSIFFCAVFVWGVSTSTLKAELKIHTLFSNGAVLQRDMPVPVWGWAKPGQEVEVEFAGQKLKTTADGKGKWQVKLSALETSSEGRQMIVRSGSEELQVADLVVGEVWFCSGQSNMAMSFGAMAHPAKDKAAWPMSDWIIKEKESAEDPLFRTFAFNKGGVDGPSFEKTIEEREGQWIQSNPENNGRFSGVAYFFGREIRKEVGVPVGLITSAKSATKIESWMPSESFEADADMEIYYKKFKDEYEKKAAVFNMEKAKEQYEKDMDKFTKLGGKKTKGNRRPKLPRHPRNDDELPGSLYNGKVNPVVPYGIRGVIWYQGEKNVNENTEKYERNLEALINGWRGRWGQGAFPFYIVQLENLGEPDEAQPVDGSANGWPLIREMQRRTLKVENTGLAVAHDLGEANNIHPKNKVDVGKRLALWALKMDYGKDLKAWSGPLYQNHEIKDGKMLISFSQSGSGLMTARKHLLDPAKPVDEELNGFVIQGNDQRWVEAKARIISDTRVEVWSDQIKDIRNVRYAFVMNPMSANLYNKEGLPASCFTTEKMLPPKFLKRNMK
jgi:sialate O-acetylesterase